MQDLLGSLTADYPAISFIAGENFFWSPSRQSVTYTANTARPDIATWSLLHEVSHGILGHKNYVSDFELVQLEVAAWHHARQLAKHYGIEIDQEHIEDCLDTYRDWLHQRATCPTCGTVSAQQGLGTYNCINCHAGWHVSSSRFCRPYRRKTSSQSN